MRLSRRDVLLAAGTVVAPFLALKSAQAAVPRLRVRGVDSIADLEERLDFVGLRDQRREELGLVRPAVAQCHRTADHLLTQTRPSCLRWTVPPEGAGALMT